MRETKIMQIKDERMNVAQQIERLKTNRNAQDALTSILYFFPNVPLKALFDEPNAIFAADSEAASNVLEQLRAYGLISVDANRLVISTTEFRLDYDCDIYKLLPPPSYLQNKQLGETFVFSALSALEKGDETMCRIWSEALKRSYKMLLRNPEAESDHDLPRFFNRLRMACELLGEVEASRHWEKKLLEYHKQSCLEECDGL